MCKHKLVHTENVQTQIGAHRKCANTNWCTQKMCKHHTENVRTQIDASRQEWYVYGGEKWDGWRCCGFVWDVHAKVYDAAWGLIVMSPVLSVSIVPICIFVYWVCQLCQFASLCIDCCISVRYVISLSTLISDRRDCLCAGGQSTLMNCTEVIQICNFVPSGCVSGTNVYCMGFTDLRFYWSVFLLIRMIRKEVFLLHAHWWWLLCSFVIAEIAWSVMWSCKSTLLLW